MTGLLTASEVAAFTGLDERRVRKEVEHGIVEAGSPPRFAFADVVYLRALELLELDLGTDDRKRLHRMIVDALSSRLSAVHIGTIMELHLAPVKTELEEKLREFEEWKSKLVTDERILGGETVFPKRRLSVRKIGEMLRRGVAEEEIVEDYPYLKRRDLEFARIYVAAYPRVGRPREQSEAPGR